VKHLDRITLEVTSDACRTRFDDLIVRVDPSFKLEVHMDTDEANACNLEKATRVQLLKS
jgi:propanediol utilization protein